MEINLVDYCFSAEKHGWHLGRSLQKVHEAFNDLGESLPDDFDCKIIFCMTMKQRGML